MKKMKIVDAMLIRYPHGWFGGGLWENDYAPALTTSAWENNNYLMLVYETEDIPNCKDMEI